MAPGDAPSDGGGSEASSPTAPPDAPAQAPHGPLDAAVESVWLGRRRGPRRLGRPRLSTVLMVAAFAGVLVLYLLVRPGG
ncbi:hypothetical protein [Nocardia farcinica]